MVGNLSAFLCLLCPACWLGECQLGLRGSPKGSKKRPQNDLKSIRNSPGRPLACPRVSGCTPQVPPRLPTCIFMHIYVYYAHINAYSCIFCAYLCMCSLVLWIFMHIVVHVTHFCHILYVYAYSDIFMNVYVYLVHVCTHLCSSRISVHIHTYLFIRRH